MTCTLTWLVHSKPDRHLLLDRSSTGAHDGYDGSFAFFRALAPAVWLAILGGSMLVALHVVGYLSEPEAKNLLLQARDLLERHANSAPRRAALAFSGVTAGTTWALCVACLFWAGSAWCGKANAYRWRVVGWAVVLLGLSFYILKTLISCEAPPFASELGWVLLNRKGSCDSSFWNLPNVMFYLACVIPAILTAGACLLLQPMKEQTDTSVAREQLQVLAGRFKELDQLLYIGALTLMFGTLQLSTAMSAPLANVPKTTELKNQVELCKTLAPATPASSPFYTSQYPGFGVALCQSLPAQLAHADTTDSLRQLVRGITLWFGLAYSALLAAIYVPGVFVLHRISKAPQRQLALTVGTANQDERPALGDTDPLRRLAAILATLSPLITGVIANAFTT